jgi:hypothetical protein
MSVNFPPHIKSILRQFDAKILEIKKMEKKAEKKSDLTQVGALWTNTSLNGNKYWSGKLKLAELVTDKLQSTGIENDAILNIVHLLEDQNLDVLNLIMFPNQNRREGRQDPTLNLFSKFSLGTPAREEDLPQDQPASTT